MKIRLLFAIGVLVLLSACSTTGNTLASSAKYDDGYDHAYMARVERAARDSGTEVQWVNPPQAHPHH